MSIILQYINNMLDCGEITRDYGIEQKTARIDKNSGKKFKVVSELAVL